MPPAGKRCKRKGEEWYDQALTCSQVWLWHWLEIPSWALLSRTWQIYAAKLMPGPGLSWGKNGASELSRADAKFQSEEKREGCGVWLLSGLPRGQSQAALGSLFCLWAALSSEGVFGSFPQLPATSSYILEVMILLNNYHVSLSFRLSRTQRPSMIISFPLPLSQLKSLLHLSDSLIIENCGHEC